MECREFEVVYEQQAEKPLPADAQAHLTQCRACSTMVANVEAILRVAREMGSEEAVPSERVWIALRAQLVSEGLIRERERVGWFAGWIALVPRPALAGLCLAAILAAAVVLSVRSPLPKTPAVAAVQEPAVLISADSQLRRVERHAVSDLHMKDPMVSASLQRNLDIVDNFIVLCEKNVREQPDNQMAREYLYGAYQQKAELLATALDRGTSGDE